MITALWLTCLSLLAPAEPGANLLANAGFETDAGWSDYGQPLTIDDTVAHSGRRSLRCALPTEGVAGAKQVITFDPPVQRPIRLRGWAKAERAVVRQDFSLYCDVHYADGTPLWGQLAAFQPGTHDWQRAEFEFKPAKPIASIEVFVLFRQAQGKVWFDDLEVCVAPLEWSRVEVRPGAYGARSLSAVATATRPGPWTARLEADGRLLAEARGERGPAQLDWLGAATDPAQAELILRTWDPAERESASERRSVALPTAGAARPVQVWTADSMDRVLPSQVSPGPLRPVDVSLAGGEAESWQVLLRAAPGHGLAGVTVQVSELVGPGGARLPAPDWQQVGYVWLERLFRHPAYPEAVAGWWPDALLPVARFDLEPSFTQALWFTVHAPAGQAPGRYTGRVVLRTAQGEVAGAPVTVTVEPFAIPAKSSLKTAFALMDGFLERVYGRPLPAAVRRRYGDFMLAHRLNPDDISRTDPPELDDLASWRGQLNAFNVLNLVEPRGTNTWRCYSDKEAYTPALKAQLTARLDQYVPRLKAARLADGAYVYTFDERGEEFFPIIREYFGLVKERYGLPTLTTAYVPLDPKVLADLNIDWACPLTPKYDLAAADRCRAAGQQVWVYVCLGPRYPYANWLADDPLAEARVFWWQAWGQRVDGVLYWGANIWDRPGNDKPIDPTAGQRLAWSITTGGEYDWLHGDGRLLYAGPDGPIGSIRLANLRDGLEDYE
ncbi:MAG: DUF4091 domain-containing protein, partial [Armatimonadetes bacterium]|nr:DUF4091 domain-containing protein [Armatimonadota bacterium]